MMISIMDLDMLIQLASNGMFPWPMLSTIYTYALFLLNSMSYLVALRLLAFFCVASTRTLIWEGDIELLNRNNMYYIYIIDEKNIERDRIRSNARAFN
jgi:hypothetical protein